MKIEKKPWNKIRETEVLIFKDIKKIGIKKSSVCSKFIGFLIISTKREEK